MKLQRSLKVRLLSSMLVPAAFLTVCLALWQYSHDKQTGEELFDRNLFSAAITISGDTATRDGDALSPSTLDKINAATGGELFYHVSGFGGVHLTGFAYPPTRVDFAGLTPNIPQFFDVTYRGEPVRAAALLNQFSPGNAEDRLVITVWQTMDERQQWLNAQLAQSALFIALTFMAIFTTVWVGVNIGLSPLRRIERDLSHKSPNDLSPLTTPVPEELAGIENRLNLLLGRLEQSQQAQHNFISDAAHQLRNPATAVHALIETLEDESDDTTLKQRIQRLAHASKNSIRVAEQLLSLERIESPNPASGMEIDLNETVRSICLIEAATYLAAGYGFEFSESPTPCWTVADPFWVAEAIKNILDNAVKHGGPSLSAIKVTISVESNQNTVRVENDGEPLTPDVKDIVVARFKQLKDGVGSGLGLSIVESVLKKYGGELEIEAIPDGTCIALKFPSSNKN